MALCGVCADAVQADMEGPCQRCGVIMPKTELKMFDSRLYCNYCIMEVSEDKKHQEERARESYKPKAERSESSQSPKDESTFGQSRGGAGGQRYYKCQKCGSPATDRYAYGGKLLCANCYFDESGEGAKPQSIGKKVMDFFISVGGGTPRSARPRPQAKSKPDEKKPGVGPQDKGTGGEQAKNKKPETKEEKSKREAEHKEKWKQEVEKLKHAQQEEKEKLKGKKNLSFFGHKAKNERKRMD
ncbi:Uncharacterised protein [Candidatus Gugararchaeum adminiculabundum]|nr:Uncharacterised protein [Candidatus Gugararchaeum adminiculabundum]